MTNYDFPKLVMDKLDFTDEAKKYFCEIEEKILADKDINKEMDKIHTFKAIRKKNFDSFAPRLQKVADKLGYNIYSLNFIVLLNSAETMFKRYKKKNIDEEIFWDSLSDIKCKLDECMQCKGVWGTFVEGWFMGFYYLERFKLGRFEYEIWDFSHRSYKKNGVEVKHGDVTIGMHIPSSGVPLTDEVRYDSYKKAYKFYKHLFKGDNVIFECSSWLLFPGNKNILHPQSNVIKFIDDFDILQFTEKYEFGDAWRVFGADADKPADELPRDTKMRAAFADWLKAGKKTGNGQGIIIFDGEKIINK